MKAQSVQNRRTGFRDQVTESGRRLFTTKHTKGTKNGWWAGWIGWVS